MRYFNVRTEKDLKGKISSQEHGHERESESSPPRPMSTRSIVVTRDPPPTSSSAVERGAKEHVLARAVIVSSGVGQLWGDPKDEFPSHGLCRKTSCRSRGVRKNRGAGAEIVSTRRWQNLRAYGSRHHINRDVQHRILFNECLYACLRILYPIANTLQHSRTSKPPRKNLFASY